MRRILDISTTLHADGEPSGVVPDGGRASRSIQSCDRVEGPDHFFIFFSKVFLVKAEDQSVFSLLVRVLFVSVPAA